MSKNTGSELLRIATAGSVDDGKSTLIGRLLHDTKSILEDQMDHITETSERRGDGYVNLALLTDGCGPSANRGSRSTSPTVLPDRRRRGARRP